MSMRSFRLRSVLLSLFQIAVELLDEISDCRGILVYSAASVSVTESVSWLLLHDAPFPLCLQFTLYPQKRLMFEFAQCKQSSWIFAMAGAKSS